jgi:hypothetical protein
MNINSTGYHWGMVEAVRKAGESVALMGVTPKVF